MRFDIYAAERPCALTLVQAHPSRLAVIACAFTSSRAKNIFLMRLEIHAAQSAQCMRLEICAAERPCALTLVQVRPSRLAVIACACTSSKCSEHAPGDLCSRATMRLDIGARPPISPRLDRFGVYIQ